MLHATNIDAAWQTAVGFRRHMAGIDAALVSVTRRLNASEGMAFVPCGTAGAETTVKTATTLNLNNVTG